MPEQSGPVSSRVPSVRVQVCSDGPVNRKGRFILYWMTAFRRARWNFSLERAVDWARELNKPLVVVETLACGLPWASDRHHRFVIEGMGQNADRFARHGVLYYPFVEPSGGSIRELLMALGDRACVVVTDDFPINAWREAAEEVASPVAVRMESVDSNGLLPLRAADRVFPTAHAFRRFLHRVLPDQLPDAPKADPLARASLPGLKGLPKDTTRRWPRASRKLLGGGAAALADLPIDHGVGPVEIRGGTGAAESALRAFLRRKLRRYLDDRNQPEEDVTSGLSPYLHFGHISVHEVFDQLARQEQWSPAKLADKATGSREGWWGMSRPAEAFLDELVTWREVGFNMSALTADYDQYESLPDWARKTLAEHAGDPREHVYSLDELESAGTHDPLWNAAQMQLAREGRMHNYLRMLWGKKILEWSASPQDALHVMIELNNKYALDGQDPNSYSGILWVLGRYDRAWGPERPIFGKIRYMSSENTARKARVQDYIARYAVSD